MTDANTFAYVIRDVQVARTLDIAHRARDFFEELWTSGNARSVAESPGGREAVVGFEAALRSSADQLLDAERSGATRVDLHIRLPVPGSRDALAIARAVMQRGRTAGVFSDEEVTYTDGLLSQAETALGAQGL